MTNEVGILGAWERGPRPQSLIEAAQLPKHPAANRQVAALASFPTGFARAVISYRWAVLHGEETRLMVVIVGSLLLPNPTSGRSKKSWR